VGANVSHQGLNQYITELRQSVPRDPLPAEALAGQLARASARVAVISMADYLKTKG
jgi:hypothetical protein